MQDGGWKRVWGPPPRPGARPDLNEVVRELLVGEYPTPSDAHWLREIHGVTAVVSLQDDGDLLSKGLRERDLDAAYRRHGMSFDRVPITDCDAAMLAARLDTAVALLAKRAADGHRIYLHCNAGMNRAPTVAIAYLHVHHRLSLADAGAWMKQRRMCVPYMSVLQARYGTAGSDP
jgi:protein-tyrosine phosphatase